MAHSNRLDYQDSPIQWHPNPMYSGGLDDMDPRSLDYSLTDLPPPIPTVVLNPSGSVQQRSISRCLPFHKDYLCNTRYLTLNISYIDKKIEIS